MGHYRFSRELPAPRLITQLVDQQTDGYLHLSGGIISWFLYLQKGKLIYATNSVDPFGRFDRYLRRLSVQIPSLVSAVRIQARLLFETSAQKSAGSSDFQAVNWLVKQRHLSLAQAAILIEELAKEVLESLLIVQEGDYELLPFQQDWSAICYLDVPSLLEFCQNRLRQRQAAGLPAAANSPVGFNPTSAYSLTALAQQAPATSRLLPTASSAVAVEELTYKIACIDDSPAVLKSINSFLNDDNFSVIMISDPVKALMQIIRIKPDLILLDVTMPNLDGYELCSLLRKHPSFRHTPVIMVTSNTGFIDRAKARLVGASGYLTKPFTQPDLVKIVFKHLT
jgi:twitching motility two-component system response regulator PilG